VIAKFLIVTGCRVNGDWASQWEWTYFDLTNKTSSHSSANLGINPTTGGFWASGWNVTHFLNLYPPLLRREFRADARQTRQRIFTFDGSNDLYWRKGVSFGSSLTLLPLKGLNPPPQQLNFGGVIRRFKPNVQTIKTFILSQRLHIFQPNFEQNITRSSAIAEGPRDASCQLKSCQLPRNSAETTYTTSPDQIDGMKLEI